MEKDFHGNFQVNVTWFFAFFSGVLDWIVLILGWIERSLHSAQVSWQRCPWPLKRMMSRAVKGTWICTGSLGRIRGKLVNTRWLLNVELQLQFETTLNWILFWPSKQSKHDNMIGVSTWILIWAVYQMVSCRVLKYNVQRTEKRRRPKEKRKGSRL